jgi:hypothetical protein
MPLIGSKSKVIVYAIVNNNKIAIELPFRSESINPRFNNINSSEALFGKRTPVGVYVGNKTYEGSIDVELFDATDAADPTLDTYRHSLLAFLFWSILGNYDSATSKVSLNTTNAPKIEAIEVIHDSSTVVYTDVYLSGFSVRFPVDGIPTATLDVRAASTGSAPTGHILVLTADDFVEFYKADNLTLYVNNDEISNKVYNFEFTLNQNLIDYFTYGSLNAAGIDAGNLELAEINIEYYPSDVATIDLNAALETAFANGTQSSVSVALGVKSLVDATKEAKITLASPFVVEFSHDISGPEYITARLGLRESADEITIEGVKIKTANN